MFGSSQRGATTDHLNNIIQVIELGRKSGVLTVERADSSQQETGQVAFIHGQITEIRVGHLAKHQALIWLKTWERCHFIFEPTAGERNTGPQPPVVNSPVSQPLRVRANSTVSQPLVELTRTTGPLRNTHAKTPIPPFVATEYKQAQEDKGQLNTASVSPVPYRTRSIPESSQLLAHAGASRLHQRLFLLIDGRRTLPDFMYLLKHSEEEVSGLLHDLEIIGVIKQ